MAVGATGPIMKAISKRRLRRNQWRIFERIAMILLDANLIYVSFLLAHYIRYNLLFKNDILVSLRNNIENNTPTKEVFTPITGFMPLIIGIIIGLIVIFAVR